jgi:predicted alpha/beta-fold hydrolase
MPLEDLSNGEGIVILVHGLESNVEGPLMTKMAMAYLAQGFACALISFRGCSGEPNLTLGKLSFYSLKYVHAPDI